MTKSIPILVAFALSAMGCTQLLPRRSLDVRPVDGAQTTAGAAMPDHGHGLPNWKGGGHE